MSTAKEVGIEGGQLGIFIDRITGIAEEMGLAENFIMMINDNAMYKGLVPPRIKPVGVLSTQTMTDIYCECGCRLNTDRQLYWCSNPRCDFIGREETF
jgi:hypothetical protein